MDFDTFIDTAWADHATDPNAVAQRLADGMALVGDESQLAALAKLAHHLHGEHLGEWRAGIDFIQHLCTLAPYVPQGESGQTVRLCVASLALSQQPMHELDSVSPTLSTSDRIRVGAMAAANLAERDTPRALHLFRASLDLAQHAGLAANDPMHRALAVAGHNLACTLEEKMPRSAEERELMVLAAQASRRCWELAGTWLEVERAEYRLAMTWLQAGDLVRARTHAQSCLGIVAANHGAALERFFGFEALGLVERVAGRQIEHAQSLMGARAAFAELEPADQAWCAASVDKLAA